MYYFDRLVKASTTGLRKCSSVTESRDMYLYPAKLEMGWLFGRLKTSGDLVG